MELLGHSDVTMTLNTYSHVLASLKEDAARRMDTALATNS
jgi:integrase